jgi:hypothetical protein
MKSKNYRPAKKTAGSVILAGAWGNFRLNNFNNITNILETNMLC